MYVYLFILITYFKKLSYVQYVRIAERVNMSVDDVKVALSGANSTTLFEDFRLRLGISVKPSPFVVDLTADEKDVHIGCEFDIEEKNHDFMEEDEDAEEVLESEDEYQMGEEEYNYDNDNMFYYLDD